MCSVGDIQRLCQLGEQIQRSDIQRHGCSKYKFMRQLSTFLSLAIHHLSLFTYASLHLCQSILPSISVHPFTLISIYPCILLFLSFHPSIYLYPSIHLLISIYSSSILLYLATHPSDLSIPIYLCIIFTAKDLLRSPVESN